MVFSLSLSLFLLIPDDYRSTNQRVMNNDVIGHVYSVMRWYFLKFLLVSQPAERHKLEDAGSLGCMHYATKC